MSICKLEDAKLGMNVTFQKFVVPERWNGQKVIIKYHVDQTRPINQRKDIYFAGRYIGLKQLKTGKLYQVEYEDDGVVACDNCFEATGTFEVMEVRLGLRNKPMWVFSEDAEITKLEDWNDVAPLPKMTRIRVYPNSGLYLKHYFKKNQFIYDFSEVQLCEYCYTKDPKFNKTRQQYLCPLCSHEPKLTWGSSNA